MISKLSITALTVLAAHVQGHYVFMRVAHNGEWKNPVQYFRNITDPFQEVPNPKFYTTSRYYAWPTYSDDLPNSARCGRGNLDHSHDTETLTIQAGDTLEVAHVHSPPAEWTPDFFVDCYEGRGTCDPYYETIGLPKFTEFNYDGPFIAHLSKVPEGTDIADYDGSGDWVKIKTFGFEVDPSTGTLAWTTSNKNEIPGRLVFKVPEQTPRGEYLLRVDLQYFGVISDPPFPYARQYTQLYPACLHINVESEYEGSLPEGGVKIPEALVDDAEGITGSYDMYQWNIADPGYVYPGGTLWTGTEMVIDRAV